jgi:hypothetical protein
VISRTTVTVTNKDGFDAAVEQVDSEVDLGCTKPGLTQLQQGISIPDGTSDPTFENMLSVFGGRTATSGGADALAVEGDNRINLGRLMSPHCLAHTDCPPDIDPNTVFDCQCEYPGEKVYTTVTSRAAAFDFSDANAEDEPDDRRLGGYKKMRQSTFKMFKLQQQALKKFSKQGL